MFQGITEYIEGSDLTIASLETKFVYDEPVSGIRLYNSPKELGFAIRDLGVNVLNMASNHGYDYGLPRNNIYIRLFR